MPATLSHSAPIEVVSADPEVMALQAMIKGLSHFGKGVLTMRHFKVLMAVELCIKLTGKNPRPIDIATFARLKPDEFDQELLELVEKKYLNEAIPLFGNGPATYRLGVVGGTIVKQMLDRKAKRKKSGNDA